MAAQDRPGHKAAVGAEHHRLAAGAEAFSKARTRWDRSMSPGPMPRRVSYRMARSVPPAPTARSDAAVSAIAQYVDADIKTEARITTWSLRSAQEGLKVCAGGRRR